MLRFLILHVFACSFSSVLNPISPIQVFAVSSFRIQLLLFQQFYTLLPCSHHLLLNFSFSSPEFQRQIFFFNPLVFFPRNCEITYYHCRPCNTFEIASLVSETELKQILLLLAKKTQSIYITSLCPIFVFCKKGILLSCYKN